MRRPRTVDSVRCFMCDIDLGHWRPGQSPYTRHATESPTCPWALLNFPDAAASANRALQVNEKDPTTQPQHKIMRSARLATFNHHHYWPPNKSLKSSRRFQVASKVMCIYTEGANQEKLKQEPAASCQTQDFISHPLWKTRLASSVLIVKPPSWSQTRRSMRCKFI